MTLFFPLPPHLQLPTSLFSHTAGSSVSKQSQETQSGVLSLLLTFKHLNSSHLLAYVSYCSVLCDIAFPLCELDAPRACIIVSCAQGYLTLCLSSVQSLSRVQLFATP